MHVSKFFVPIMEEYRTKSQIKSIENIKIIIIWKNDVYNIPGSNNSIYKLEAVVFHILFDYSNECKGGHYVIWVRSLCETGWIRISDSIEKYYQNLISDLKDITFMLLEKL